MTDTADELRVAARVLRALLADRELTPGPWLSMDRGDRVLWDGEGAYDQPPVYVVNEPMSNGANAEWIAAMHPGVGTPLVALLEQAAKHHDDGFLCCDQGPDSCSEVVAPALAVARAINTGEQQ